MNIEFADGEAGFLEARVLYRLARQRQDLDPPDSDEIQALDQLRSACETHFRKPEFAARSDAAMSGFESALVGQDSWWRSWFGPSRREAMLSTQRAAALARAQRAERSSFEAVAETARVARERDEALTRVRELEARLEVLERG